MSLWALTPAKPTIGFTKILAIGALIAAAIVSAPTLLGPAKVGFALCGMLLLIPAVLVRDPRAYGLFLLVVSIPIDVSMHTTKWLAHPDVLFQEFGMPASGTLGVDLYLTDVVLIAMLLPWLAELWRRERELYFPSAAYIAILYFAWALIVSLLEAKSVYLAIFELSRQILYFVFFVYICNNVVTPAQFRAVLMGFFVGLVLESAAVIAFFQLGIGTETDVFSDLLYGSTASPGTLTVAQTGSWSKVSRSAGTFAHRVRVHDGRRLRRIGHDVLAVGNDRVRLQQRIVFRDRAVVAADLATGVYPVRCYRCPSGGYEYALADRISGLQARSGFHPLEID